jgi:hypothetical protein
LASFCAFVPRAPFPGASSRRAPRPANWVRFAHFALRGPGRPVRLASFPTIGPTELGLFVQPAPGPAARRGRPAKLGLFVQDPRHRSPDTPGRPSLALFVHSDTTPHGRVPPNWVCLYNRTASRPIPPANWLCLFTVTRLLAPGHARLGLFVQLSPASPGELALFVQTSISAHWLRLPNHQS